MTTIYRARGAAAALIAAVLLAGCMLLPGKFAAALDLRKDGRFSFTYTGEITVLGLTRLAEMGAKADAGSDKFEAEPCFDEEYEKEHKCSDAEIAEQKKTWEENRTKAAEKRERDLANMKMVFGGIDPTSPQAAEELAERLRKQAGWKRVEVKGNGLYDVDFAMSGRLDHDFVFPTVERVAMVNPFVNVLRRADRSVRIDAPAFGPQQNGGLGATSPIGLMAAAAAADADKDGTGIGSAIPQPEGTFTLTTDGQILANNTVDGPAAVPTGQKLEWKITPRSEGAPMALVKAGG